MPLAQRRYWVFNMDGTLTQAIHDFAYMRRMLEVPPEADILAYLHALPEKEAQARFAWLHEYEATLAQQAVPAEGIDRVLALVSAWNVTPDTLVMVGDSMLDIDTGRAAGALTVLMQPAPNKQAHLADLWVANAKTLYDAIFDD